MPALLMGSQPEGPPLSSRDCVGQDGRPRAGSQAHPARGYGRQGSDHQVRLQLPAGTLVLKKRQESFSTKGWGQSVTRVRAGAGRPHQPSVRPVLLCLCPWWPSSHGYVLARLCVCADGRAGQRSAHLQSSRHHPLHSSFKQPIATFCLKVIIVPGPSLS